MKYLNNKKIYFLFLILIFIISIITANSLVIDSNKNALLVTLEHPFYMNNIWIKASELKVGDLLTTIDGNKAIVTKITDVETEESIDVYNFEDRLYNNYIAKGVVVHNSNTPIDVPEITDATRKKFANSEQRPLSEVHQMSDEERLAYAESRIGELSREEKEAVLYANRELETNLEKIKYLESKGLKGLEGDILLGEGILGDSVKGYKGDVPYYEFGWGKTSRNLMAATDDAGALQILSMENMLEKIAVDGPDPLLETKIIKSYETYITPHLNNPSFDELQTNLAAFNSLMHDELPFLGSTVKKINQDGNVKTLLYKYLLESEEKIPRLSELGRTGNLDCTAQALTIRESLGGDESGWKMFHDVVRGKSRVHTFLAKEFTLKNGQKVYGVIDPSELNIMKAYVIGEGDFRGKYIPVKFSKTGL